MEWLPAARKVLRSLRSCTVDDEQLHLLHVNIHENDKHIFQANQDVIDKFTATAEYLTEVRWLELPVYVLRTPPLEMTSKDVSSYIGTWMKRLLRSNPYYQTLPQIVVKYPRRLLVTSDKHSRGLKPQFTIEPVADQVGPFMAAIIRNRRRKESSLASAELYALFAMAENQLRRHPSLSTLAVRILVIHGHWVQVLQGTMSSSYARSILNGSDSIIGKMDILRSPYFNMLNDIGRKQLLQATFENVPLQKISRLVSRTEAMSPERPVTQEPVLDKYPATPSSPRGALPCENGRSISRQGRKRQRDETTKAF